jgi:hypothetical protein
MRTSKKPTVYTRSTKRGIAIYQDVKLDEMEVAMFLLEKIFLISILSLQMHENNFLSLSTSILLD